jgi:hypothetical protein
MSTARLNTATGTSASISVLAITDRDGAGQTRLEPEQTLETAVEASFVAFALCYRGRITR